MFDRHFRTLDYNNIFWFRRG